MDPRKLPSYGIAEASHYLRVPLATLRSWIRGRPYPVTSGSRKSKPVIILPDSTKPLLSFMNLAEVHVLDAITKKHRVRLQSVRKALDYLEKEFNSKSPLIENSFQTDGKSLFVEKLGNLINATDQGQLVMKEAIEAYLSRIEYDAQGLAAKLYPFTRKRTYDEPKNIVIDPRIAFGRPVVAGTGICTAVIAERYKAGESVKDLASDYNRTFDEIEEAIRCELQLLAA